MVAVLVFLCTLLGLSTAATFSLNDTTGGLCLLLEGNLTAVVNGSSTSLTNTSVESFCNLTARSALLVTTLSAGSGMSFKFEGNSTVWGLTQISYTAGNNVIVANYNSLFNTINNQESYECDVYHSVSFPSSPDVVALNVSNWRAQAFNFSSQGRFDSPVHCVLDPTPVPTTTPTITPSPSASPVPRTTDNKVIPIAVGAGLAGLVIIVLVVYLIGRFKSRRETSYQVLP